MAKKKPAVSDLDRIKDMIGKLSDDDRDLLLKWMEAEAEPDTSDFEDEDWENVDRMRADGNDRLSAVKQQRIFIDENQ